MGSVANLDTTKKLASGLNHQTASGKRKESVIKEKVSSMEYSVTDTVIKRIYVLILFYKYFVSNTVIKEDIVYKYWINVTNICNTILHRWSVIRRKVSSIVCY